ncbi:MAG: DUF192 domain-containing protein [Steroidobacteraceae bacterium]
MKPDLKFAPRVIGACLLSTALLLGTLAGADSARADVTAPEPLAAFPQSLLAIRTASGKVVNFKIWTADRPSRQEQGLMFVHDIDDHAGMLFLFEPVRQISMWMKNTYLSLDLLFIDATGRIDYIAPRATPLSTDIISDPRPVAAVLELKGGICDQFKIQVGDRAIHTSLGTAP